MTAPIMSTDDKLKVLIAALASIIKACSASYATNQDSAVMARQALHQIGIEVTSDSFPK